MLYHSLPRLWLQSALSCAGFEAAVQEFEEWTQLLLLDALQRSGIYVDRSDSRSLAELQSKVPASYARFMAESTSMLEASGKSQ